MFFKKQIKRLKKAGTLIALGGVAYCAYHAGCHRTKAKLKTSNERKLSIKWENHSIRAFLSLPNQMKRFQTYPCVLILTNAEYPQDNSKKLADALASKDIISLRYTLPCTHDLTDENRLEIAEAASHLLKRTLHINHKLTGIIGIGDGCKEALALTQKQESFARCLWNLNIAVEPDEIDCPLLCINATNDDIINKKNAKMLVNNSHDASHLLIKDNNSLLAGKALDAAILHTAAFMKRHLV